MNKDILSIEIIKRCILQRKIIWTKHCLNRINQRNIEIKDIKNAVNTGKIIEYYDADYPYPSCLILGRDTKGKTIHIVCGKSEETIYMITAYYPDMTKWNEDRRK